MTTHDRSTSRPRATAGQPSSPLAPADLGQRTSSAPDPTLGGNLDGDTVYNYGLDGFKPARVDKSGANDPQEVIDLEALAEQVYLLLLREAYIERERRGARR
jgi:hypothetical protein